MTGKELIAALQSLYEGREQWDAEVVLSADAEWNLPTVEKVSYRSVFFQGGNVFDSLHACRQNEPMVYDYRIVIDGVD